MHKPSGYSLITCCSFDKSKNEQKYYRGKDCMKTESCGKEKESYENRKICHICEERFLYR